MSKPTIKKPLVAAIGAAVVGTLSVTGAVASENPFGLKQLDSGYMQTAMEGKCGGSTTEAAKSSEGKCGGAKEEAPKMMEGKCGEGKCGENMNKAPAKSAEGKCGEAKCGGAQPAPAKAAEGKCGEAKCGGKK